MPSVYQPRRPRASPLWQIVHHAWGEFLATYEHCNRKAHGPLRPDTIDVVERFYRCGDYLVFHPHLHVLAAAVEHIPPKNQHTIRYYGRYSNKSRGLEVRPWKPTVDPATPHTIPAPPRRSVRNLRPLWRNLIIRVLGQDPLTCPCRRGLMRHRGRLQRPEEIQFFLRLHGMWEGMIDIPPPPEPPYDIETMDP